MNTIYRYAVSCLLLATVITIIACGQSKTTQTVKSTPAPVAAEPPAEPATEVPEGVITNPNQHSIDELERMAKEYGEINEDMIPAFEFWDRVEKDGSFARFREALKKAKNDEDRWKIADEFPEIAERSGMTEALSARDSTKISQ